MIWPVRGTVLSDFAKNGKGLDIGAAAGSVVVSAGAGEVIFVGSGVKGYGQLVIVRHTPTLVTAYGHNSKIVVQTGDKVKAGQKIAESGNTEAERPMLRFEVRDTPPSVRIEAETRTTGPTGVEMEAIIAAQTAAAVIYDMCKAVQRDIVISRVRLLFKDGGRSGAFHAKPLD